MIARTTKFDTGAAAFAILVMSVAAVYILSTETTAQPSLRPNGKDDQLVT